MANIKENINNWCETHQTACNVFGIFCLLVLILCLVLFVFWLATPSGKIDNDGLVIAFIGVLATFIVVGNFAQTSRIEEQLKTLINDLDKRVVVCETNDKQIPTIKENLTTLRQQKERIDNLENEFHESSQPLDKKDLARVLKLFIGREGDVRKYMQLYAKFLNPDSRYFVEFINGEKEQITIRYDEYENDIEYFNIFSYSINPAYIRRISGLPFVHEDIRYAYLLLNELETGETEVKEEEVQKQAPSEISDTDQIIK